VGEEKDISEENNGVNITKKNNEVTWWWGEATKDITEENNEVTLWGRLLKI
jgi:hypothetical protein